MKTWRLEKFSNRDFLRREKVAELFYASERKNCKQNSSLIRNFLLNSNTQDFRFCKTQFCTEKDLNRNLVIQEGAKNTFSLKKHLQKPFPQYSIKATKRNLRFFHFLWTPTNAQKRLSVPHFTRIWADALRLVRATCCVIKGILGKLCGLPNSAIAVE